MKTLNGRADILLQHPVKLERLACGETQGMAAMRPRQFVHLQPLLGRADPAGKTHAHHEGKSGLQLLAPPLVANVPVILLIDAVELHQLVVLEHDAAADPVEKVERDSAAKLIAVMLQPLVGAELVQRLGEILAAIDDRGLDIHGQSSQ